MLTTISNLSRFTIPAGFDCANRLTFPLDGFTITAMGSDADGYTIYRCESGNETFYATSETFDGSHWMLERSA